jgi:hypothetical protein
MNPIIDNLIALAQLFGFLAIFFGVLTMAASLWECRGRLRHRIHRPLNQEKGND